MTKLCVCHNCLMACVFGCDLKRVDPKPVHFLPSVNHYAALHNKEDTDMSS